MLQLGFVGLSGVEASVLVPSLSSSNITNNNTTKAHLLQPRSHNFSTFYSRVKISPSGIKTSACCSFPRQDPSQTLHSSHQPSLTRSFQVRHNEAHEERFTQPPTINVHGEGSWQVFYKILGMYSYPRQSPMQEHSVSNTSSKTKAISRGASFATTQYLTDARFHHPPRC